MTRTRVTLARVWQVSPVALRDVTIAELAAMAEVLEAEAGG